MIRLQWFRTGDERKRGDVTLSLGSIGQKRRRACPHPVHQVLIATIHLLCLGAGNVPKGGATSPFPEQRPEKKACSLNTAHMIYPQNPQVCSPCFGRGRAKRWRHHPVTREQRPEKKACPLNTVSGVTPRTHRLVNRINSRVAEGEGEHT